MRFYSGYSYLGIENVCCFMVHQNLLYAVHIVIKVYQNIVHNWMSSSASVLLKASQS